MRVRVRVRVRVRLRVRVRVRVGDRREMTTEGSEGARVASPSSEACQRGAAPPGEMAPPGGEMREMVSWRSSAMQRATSEVYSRLRYLVGIAGP